MNGLINLKINLMTKKMSLSSHFLSLSVFFFFFFIGCYWHDNRTLLLFRFQDNSSLVFGPHLVTHIGTPL